MRTAVAAIPNCYIRLSLESETWYWFVATIVVMIHAMQTFERAALRLIETLILYPARRILHTYQHGDPTMMEYYSATCALLFGLWVVLGIGRPQQGLIRQITIAVPWWVWANPSVLIGFFQGISVHHGNHNTRALCSFLAFLLWTWLSAISYRRLGFNAIHAFTVPLMLACWISTFMHIRRANGNGSAADIG